MLNSILFLEGDDGNWSIAIVILHEWGILLWCCVMKNLIICLIMRMQEGENMSPDECIEETIKLIP